MIKQAAICFFIGTEAELIKMFPVIIETQKRGIHYKIISSGQNEISFSNVLKRTNGGRIDVLLSNNADIKKSAVGLLLWFIRTSLRAINMVKKSLHDVDFKKSIMVVHGDTVSTVLGARLGKKLGMKVAHVEAGLRSHDIFNPFPEELDRIITSRYARFHFAPETGSFNNLRRVKGVRINTQQNTILDSLLYSQKVECSNEVVLESNKSAYFVFVLHRQENLIQRELVSTLVDKVIRTSRDIKCIFILHEPTRIAFENMGILNRILDNTTIATVPRLDYFDFMKLLANAKFVITDGGSNQEELSYMGRPCLVIRKKTERSDGIGKNVVLYEGDYNKVDEFVNNYQKYEYRPEYPEVSPSKLIVDTLETQL
ncbi:UDP-N-acetylglucosamine 2-epimerase [Paenibacillus humicus]|uniref:UDP-N-acetylglucosamine 2-epimerase n=1 Tax=Paenibacillus humicus TaxID=412861 RepID=UPI003F1618C3